ncbi:mucin-2 [Zootoca vivipara]|uniref:mucin-2 n=1 Tax=Zootoca vivipara TaxID=8524 RepID=UPI0015905524|nr:salivary glue protein Sgs-3-like isoform X2 [Zootoca vivipara]XP_060137663.1 mucin-2 [Zootoca vivipara]
METRSLLRQIIGYGMPFGILILLTVAAQVDGQVSATSNTRPVGSTSFTPTPGLTSERVSTELATSPSPAKPSALPLSQSTAAAKKTSLKATTAEATLQDSSTDEDDHRSSIHPSTTETAVVGQKIAVSPTTEAAVVGQKIATSPTTEAAVVGQKFATSPTTEAAVVGQKFATSPTMEAAVVGQKSGTTSGMANPLNTTTAPLKTSVGSSLGLKPRSNSKQTTKGEARPSPTPKQDVLDDTKTTDNRTLRPAQRPPTTTAVPQTPGTARVPRASPEEKKNHTGIIVAAVLCALLLLIVLIAVLLCRRRRRSGSTSFNERWAGQAALPDDLALDRDVEQGAAPAKEEETKRNTLITFSGKRQSRVPSVAMEEIGEKGEREENQKLLCRDAGGGSSPEASGQANGKLPESTMQSSQEIVLSPPPANQE